jgi:DNA polymerase-3 subunit alpha
MFALGGRAFTKLKGKFMDGAKKNNIEEKTADKIFEQIVFFGGYGFNKSHATAYGLLAYQTAFLKANYPHEYMCALITSSIGHGAVGKEEGSKMVEYITDSQAMGIELLPPDVRHSDMPFTLSGTGPETKIRFGLLAVKNVGEGAVEQILLARKAEPFKNFDDFCVRVDLKSVNRKVMESLIKAGAFDWCGGKIEELRPRLIASLERAMEVSLRMRREQSIGQGSLFGADEISNEAGGTAVQEPAPEWHEHELLSNEKEVLGFYLSGHPLAKFKDELKFYSTHTLGALPANGDPRLRVAGIIENVRRLVSKQSKSPYARFKLEDLDGEIDCVVFPKSYQNGLSELIGVNQMVVVSGRLNKQAGDEAAEELIVEQILPLDKARETLVKKIVVKVPTAGLESELAQKLKDLLVQYAGPCPVLFLLHTPTQGDYYLEPELKVKISPDLLEEVTKLLGENSYKLIPRPLEIESRPRFPGR